MTARWRAFTMLGALVVIWIVFAVATHGTFLLPRNLALLARQMSVTSLLAMAMVLVIVAGQIDLSVGAMTGLLGAISALALVQHAWPLPAAFALPIGLGAGLGFTQGQLVARLRIPPFIVTLGGMLVFQGALLGITGGVSTSPTRAYILVGQAYMPRVVGWSVAALAALLFIGRDVRSRAATAHAGDNGQRRSRLPWTGLAAAALGLGFTAVMNAYEGIPIPVLLVLALGAVLSVVTRHTPFGRHLYAIGGNREAAFYSGIDINRHLTGVFTIMGAMCGVAGVVLTARVGAATSEAGRMMELDAIAAAVIGGTSLLGGQGTIRGALVGALVMASLDNGMSLLNTEAFWQPVLKGGILVAAVAADIASRRRS